MSTRSLYLHAQAVQCRQLAQAAQSDKVAVELLRLAADCETLARELIAIARLSKTLH